MTVAVHVVIVTLAYCRKISGIGGIFVEVPKWFISMIPLSSQMMLCSFFGHPSKPPGHLTSPRHWSDSTSVHPHQLGAWEGKPSGWCCMHVHCDLSIPCVL